MDKEFLVQMRQSNKCGRFTLSNDQIFDLHLESGAGQYGVTPPPYANDSSQK